MCVNVCVHCCHEQETALTLISEGRLLDLKLLLQHEFLVPLQPLVLLLGWDRYRDVGSGQKLLDCLWPWGLRKEVQCYVYLQTNTCMCVCVCMMYLSVTVMFHTLFHIDHLDLHNSVNVKVTLFVFLCITLLKLHQHSFPRLILKNGLMLHRLQ